MARDWLEIRVELLGGMDIVCDPPPGRDIAVGPKHTFADLAHAINAAFARWDLGHLHGFELADGRQIGYADEMDGEWIGHESVRVASAVAPGDEFAYTFDFGDDWRHRCTVKPETIEAGDDDELPPVPFPVWGWGAIPDQYGRTDPGDED